MALPAVYRSVAALLVSVTFFVMGGGLLTTIIPLGGRAHGFSERELGAIGSCYFAGMLIGALINPLAVRHSGHARAFVGSIAISVIATLILPVFQSPIAWMMSRGLIGFAFAGLYATVEGWLQGKADNKTRGSVLALYSVTQYGGWAIGNQLVHLDEPTSFVLYSIAAAALTAGILPLVVTTQEPPERPATPKLPFLWLIRTAPIGVVSVFLIGAANGPFWSLVPVYAATLGYTPDQVAVFVTFITLGSAALQIPIGRVSDRFDRRLVLIALVLSAATIEMALARFGGALPFWGLLVTGFALGTVLSTPYYVATAHTNDRAGRTQAVGVAAVLLFAYCVGAIIGPLTAAEGIRRFGPGALHVHNAIVHATIAAFVLYRTLVRAAPERRPETPQVRPPA